MMKTILKLFLYKGLYYTLPFPKYVFKHELDKLIDNDTDIPSSNKDKGTKYIKFKGWRDNDTFKLYPNGSAFYPFNFLINTPAKGYIHEKDGLVKITVMIDGLNCILGHVLKLILFITLTFSFMIYVGEGVEIINEIEDPIMGLFSFAALVFAAISLSILTAVLICILPYLYFKAKANSLERDMNDLMKFIEHND